mmetsp:Transcript_2839/g.6649  ORF Transcript_2839/g.6649 Transcript_2839/m.6649 type:complete len:333 (-) Transcript_2839:372-1370(-)
MLEPCDDVQEQRRTELAEAASAQRFQVPEVRPLCPQCPLRYALFFLDNLRAAPDTGVAKLASADDVHRWRRRDLTCGEEHVAGRQECHGHGAVAHLLHDLWVRLGVAVHESVAAHERRVHLEVDLHTKRLGHTLQQRHAVLTQIVHMLLDGALRIPLDPKHQLLGDLVPVEELPELGKITGRLAPENVQLRHGRGEVANEHSSHDKGNNEASDVEQALSKVLGCDFVHAPCKLRQGPLEAHGIGLTKGGSVVVVRLYPRPLRVRIAGADTIPTTRKDVSNGNDGKQVLDDTENDVDPMGADALTHELHALPQPHQPQEPHEPEHADAARGSE